MSQSAPNLFTLWFCVITVVLMLSICTDKVCGGGTRSLTLDEITQLKSTGALSKYNTLDGRDDEADDDGLPVSHTGGRKARCFFGGQGTATKVPIQTWAIDPRLQYVRGDSTQQSQSPQYYYEAGYNPYPAQLPASAPQPYVT